MKSRAVALKDAYLEFIRSQIPAATPPATLSGWSDRLASVKVALTASFGRVPEQDAPLEPEILGIIKRDGYVIERLTFQTRPGVRLTANLYRPDVANQKFPGVLQVHGHWSWARMDPHVQMRCLGLTKLGYVCLAVDAFGAGERAIEPAPGTYHGASTGASLWPAGLTLNGVQVYDNRRAIDYLISRPEVDSTALGMTGASGGGNQTLYSGATDDRIKAIVPVCGIGTLEAYVGMACCVCEVLPGALKYAKTGDLLAMMAPRALLVINASRDAIQFSPAEAKKSLDFARERYRRLDASTKVAHLVVESGHDYSKPMREAMYGWMNQWLKGQGDGSPVPEPDYTIEEIATLRCYPEGASRPKTIVTIPQLAQAETEARLKELLPLPDHVERRQADAALKRSILETKILGGFPKRVPLEASAWSTTGLDLAEGAVPIEITTEPGLRLRGVLYPPGSSDLKAPVQLVLSPGGIGSVDAKWLASMTTSSRVFVTELRATGFGKPDTGAVHGSKDHHETEWGLWIGRPLLGQWAWDVVRWLDLLTERNLASSVVVTGRGAFGPVALVAGALDSRVSRVRTYESPASFLGYGNSFGMGGLAPGILEVGDIGHLASLIAPRPLTVTAPFGPDGKPAAESAVRAAYAPTNAIYRLLDVADRFKMST